VQESFGYNAPAKVTNLEFKSQWARKNSTEDYAGVVPQSAKLMSWQYAIRIILVGGLVPLFVYSSLAMTRKTTHLADGLWGGTGIKIEVGSKSATVEYDCANGSILGPLSVDKKGHFNWHGTLVREHGGPIRSDEVAKQEPAIYAGSVKGDTMSLTVTLARTNEAIGPFSLKRGSAGRLRKCL